MLDAPYGNRRRIGPTVPLEFRQKYPETDWRGFVGLRDILIHKFDAIDDDILWEIVQDELPLLIIQLEAILNAED